MRRAGFIDVQCVEAYSSHCRGSIRLSGQGQIVFDGATPTPVDPDRFAVTGGTGKLRGVSGELVVSLPERPVRGAHAAPHLAELTLDDQPSATALVVSSRTAAS